MNNIPLHDLIVSDELNSISNITSAGIGFKLLSNSNQALQLQRETLKHFKDTSVTSSLIAREEFKLLKEILSELQQLKENIEKLNNKSI